MKLATIDNSNSILTARYSIKTKLIIWTGNIQFPYEKLLSRSFDRVRDTKEPYEGKKSHVEKEKLSINNFASRFFLCSQTYMWLNT